MQISSKVLAAAFPAQNATLSPLLSKNTTLAYKAG